MNRIGLMLTALFVVLATLTFSQEDLNEKDNQGRKHGTWEKKYPNGNIMYEGEFEHGKPVGEFKRYHRNGELQAIMFHKNDDRVYAELYDKKGKKRAEGIYISQKKDSTWSFYNDKGELISTEMYSNGLRNGKSVKYYSNGDTAQVMRYDNGKKNGLFTDYFGNGTIQMQGYYDKGELDGKLIIFYPDGQEKIVGAYEDNLKEGEWIYFNEDGDTSEVLNYIDGVPENKDSLDRMETKEIIELEENEGKFGDPEEMFYEERNRRR